MADSGKAPEPMETGNTEAAKTGKGSSKDSKKDADKGSGAVQAKPGGSGVKVTGAKNSSGFSAVSPMYSQLTSGLQDIVKSYVGKGSTINKGASGSGTKPEEKRTDETNGKRKKDDSDAFAGEDNHSFLEDFLDRTKSDYYCKVCDSHMNSEQMWENHVQGKRHLKNIKKDPSEPPSKVKAVKTDLVPKILKTLDQIREPVVGLDYMCELQRAESYLDPTYSCFLCHATCTVSSVVDHILGTKHRLAYLKEANPAEYKMVEEMKLKKSGMTSIAEDYAREYERNRSRGRMEVKIEKPKMAPPPSKKERRYLDDSDDELPYRWRLDSPPENDWRRGRYSPPPSALMSIRSAYMPSSPNYAAMTMVEKLSVLRQVSSNLIVVSETEASEVMQILNSLTQSLLQYKIRVLPPQVQDRLARHIISGDSHALEAALGAAGMSNVGINSVINSMAASGDLPMAGMSAQRLHSSGDLPAQPMMRGVSPPHHLHNLGRMGPGNMGGMNSSDGARGGPWGLPGPGARMSPPGRGGFHSTAYPSSSQWQGGMGGGSFRSSDRSSLGY